MPEDDAMRKIYLAMKPLSEARRILDDRFPDVAGLPAEMVPAPQAVGRVLAQAVTASLSSPHFHAAAMDGFAVDASVTYGASETRPKRLTVDHTAFAVNTGHVLPKGCNAVVMIENVHPVSPDGRELEIESPVFPWQHVRKMGEDIVATELLFPRHHVVTPYCLGALLAGGAFEVPVVRRPRVVIIATGSELVDWQSARSKPMRPGQVLDTNSWVLGALVTQCGGDWERSQPVPDDPDRIQEAIATAAGRPEVDLVMTVGGSSAGSEDHTLSALTASGEVLVHGVTMMPGKPVLAGAVAGKPFFGMPGYPVSTIMAFEQLVQPLLSRMQGREDLLADEVAVVPSRNIASRLGLEEFVRVKLGAVGDRIVATTLPRGAGAITTLTQADGIIRIPEDQEGVSSGQPVTATLLRPRSQVNTTVVVVGSHDNTLDVLADELRSLPGGPVLSSSHVGSMGGLMALKRGVCHMAGSHLLDPRDGCYNESYIRRYLKGQRIALVNLVLREQGLIVLRGNPKRINRLADLAREDVTMINRQGGSGTRVLLDHSLAKEGIDPRELDGYASEEFTHMSVAVAVLSGAADVGLGIYAAAKALALDFVPFVQEQYDLVIPAANLELTAVRRLLETIETPAFKKRVAELGGYSTDKTGTMTTIT
jgi:putative molybdopterin biosynthesis protein